jgi:hypothetical protein
MSKTSTLRTVPSRPPAHGVSCTRAHRHSVTLLFERDSAPGGLKRGTRLRVTGLLARTSSIVLTTSTVGAAGNGQC